MKEKYFITCFLIIFTFACTSSSKKNDTIILEGYAQGTTYSISYWETKKNYQRAVDSLLIAFDNSLSTYNKKSIITKFNTCDSVTAIDSYFKSVFNLSKEIYLATNGAFDPTVSHLVNAWGFGFKNTEKTDSSTIDSLLKFVDFDGITIQNDNAIKKNKNLMLDFNAIAQGYSVDVLANFFKNQGVKNYLIEIGGEIIARGRNMNGKTWRVGIDKPIENQENRALKAIITLENAALATSGNYRKFYEKDGVKYSHTINPVTGYPVRHTLLSATVVTKDCATADAYATAFMVVGLEKSKEILIANPTLEALLIYANEDGTLSSYSTPKLTEAIEIVE
ncbi:MAG: thiamine biosynthesis protein ApbE [Bacteroidetes bacterium HGW-Bacteroidetes-12]|nr:MAG: thiamine biosynthesis protein ApbE [Bacteroidetes bacterium HGW-Bacteroidetes-12]